MIISDQPLVLTDFSGGLDTKTNPVNIPLNKSPYCINVHTNVRGAAVARNGFTQLNSSAGSGNANGLYDYSQNQTTRLLIQYRGTTLQKMDSLDGTWDTITQADTMANDQMEFDTFDLGTGANRLVMSNHSGTNNMQYWDGSGSTTEITDSDAGTPRYIKVWHQRVFGIGDNSDPNNLRWSDSGSVTSWSSTNNIDIISNDGDFPTGIGILKRNMYIFKRYSIHRVTYTGGTPLIEVSLLIAGTGCISSKTIKNANIPQLGEVLMFLTADKRIVAFTGHSEGIYNISDDISIDNKVSPISMENISDTNITESHAVVQANKFRYICFAPQSGSSLPDYALVYDYLNKSWWPWSNMKFGASAVVINNNQTRVYAQGHSVIKTFRLDNGDDDDGSSINRVWVTSRIIKNSSSLLSSSNGVQIILKQLGDRNINFHHRANWNSQWSDATSISMKAATSLLGDNLQITLGGDEAVMVHADIPELKNIIQFKFETNNTDSPWSLYRAEELSRTRGIKP